MSACLCASVMVIALFFSGLCSGVCDCSSSVFASPKVGGTGKAGMLSLEATDALADAACFCLRGGIARRFRKYYPLDADGRYQEPNDPRDASIGQSNDFVVLPVVVYLNVVSPDQNNTAARLLGRHSRSPRK